MSEKNEPIRVVYCEPGKLAKIKEIKTGLEPAISSAAWNARTGIMCIRHGQGRAKMKET